ncbi:MAG TPA: hypothetical protein VIK61_13980 [Acidimicrobiia bacterium]
MRRCGMFAALVGVAVWSAVHALVSLVICVIFAVPFGLVLAFDALAREHAPNGVTTAGAPSPPRQPILVPVPTRLAA